MVLRQDQTNRGREETADGSERTRRLPDPRLRVPEKRLLVVRPWRRHRQALPDSSARRRRIFHRQTDDLQVCSCRNPVGIVLGLGAICLDMVSIEIFDLDSSKKRHLDGPESLKSLKSQVLTAVKSRSRLSISTVIKCQSRHVVTSPSQLGSTLETSKPRSLKKLP